MKWLMSNLCFVTKAGSNCYGTALPATSDLDVKGFCLPPIEVREHLFNRFEQVINNSAIEEKWGHLRNVNNPIFESTIYSLSKFVQLAANANPNVLELLYVDPSDILFCNKIAEKLIENRDLFLSSRLKFALGGYSWAQFYRIERHRKWLVKGDIKKPERADYGLSGESLKGHQEINRIITKQIEEWNLSRFGLDTLQMGQLKDSIFDCVYYLSNNKITWDNWPMKFEEAALTKFVEEFNLSKDISNLIVREIQYKNDLKEYQNWLHWKAERNLDRMKLEKAYQYDTKHASHLVRLLETAEEVLSGKGYIVKRPNAAWLLEIRNGKWTYDELKEWFDKKMLHIDELYKTTKLPKTVNYEKINELYCSLIA